MDLHLLKKQLQALDGLQGRKEKLEECIEYFERYDVNMICVRDDVKILISNIQENDIFVQAFKQLHSNTIKQITALETDIQTKASTVVNYATIISELETYRDTHHSDTSMAISKVPLNEQVCWGWFYDGINAAINHLRKKNYEST